jgi:hypothetical protein
MLYYITKGGYNFDFREYWSERLFAQQKLFSRHTHYGKDHVLNLYGEN